MTTILITHRWIELIKFTDWLKPFNWFVLPQLKDTSNNRTNQPTNHWHIELNPNVENEELNVLGRFGQCARIESHPKIIFEWAKTFSNDSITFNGHYTTMVSSLKWIFFAFEECHSMTVTNHSSMLLLLFYDQIKYFSVRNTKAFSNFNETDIFVAISYCVHWCWAKLMVFHLFIVCTIMKLELDYYYYFSTEWGNHDIVNIWETPTCQEFAPILRCVLFFEFKIYSGLFVSDYDTQTPILMYIILKTLALPLSIIDFFHFGWIVDRPVVSITE